MGRQPHFAPGALEELPGLIDAGVQAVQDANQLITDHDELYDTDHLAAPPVPGTAPLSPGASSPYNPLLQGLHRKEQCWCGKNDPSRQQCTMQVLRFPMDLPVPLPPEYNHRTLL